MCCPTIIELFMRFASIRHRVQARDRAEDGANVSREGRNRGIEPLVKLAFYGIKTILEDSLRVETAFC